jgi:hypothetical protein
MPIHDWTRVSAGIFHHFHHEWISAISQSLNSGLLPADYYALAEQVAGGLGPDVLTLETVARRRGQESGNGPATDAAHGGIALAVAPPMVRFTAAAEKRKKRYTRKLKRVVVRHVSGDRVVAMIEIVSPGNKASRRTVESFVDKAVELLIGGIHLLIIDLFPAGRRDPEGIHGAIWSEIDESEFHLPPDLPLTLVAYSAGEPEQAFIEPTRVGAALRDMPLFLEPDYYVLVPLEKTYQAAFEAVPKRWQQELT